MFYTSRFLESKFNSVHCFLSVNISLETFKLRQILCEKYSLQIIVSISAAEQLCGNWGFRLSSHLWTFFIHLMYGINITIKKSRPLKHEYSGIQRNFSRFWMHYFFGLGNHYKNWCSTKVKFFWKNIHPVGNIKEVINVCVKFSNFNFSSTFFFNNGIK